MLKRFSSLILALAIGSSVLAGTVRPSNEHVCKMAGMGSTPGAAMMDHDMEIMPSMQMRTASPALSQSHEMMPGMETMPCCKNHKTRSILSECCINIPQETGSSGTTFNLRLPSFSVAVIHPAIVRPPITAPKPYEFLYSTEVFLRNLQTSYLRNLSFLI